MKTSFLFFLFFLLYFLVHAQNYKTQIFIVYTNSANGYLESCDCPTLPYGGLARRLSIIKKLCSRNTVIVDSGDLLPAEQNMLLTEYCLRLAKYCNYDAVNIGDQEIIQGLNFIKQFKDIPFITANILPKNTTEVSPFFPSYIIKEINKIKIAITGVISLDTLSLVNDVSLKNIKVQHHMNCLNNLIPFLRQQADLVVLLSHCGLEEDKRIAKQINGIDVIISGHSQDLLFRPLKINSTLIVQAGKNGYYVGKLTLQIKKTNKEIKIERYKNQLILLDRNISVEKEAQEIIDEYNNKIKKQTEKFLIE